MGFSNRTDCPGLYWHSAVGYGPADYEPIDFNRVGDMADSKLGITCLSIDCPERKGDACRHDLDGTLDNLVRDLSSVVVRPKSYVRERITALVAEELRQVRMQYDAMEFAKQIDDMETPAREYVTWRGWKMVRNVITDRIEKLTGHRQ